MPSPPDQPVAAPERAPMGILAAGLAELLDLVVPRECGGCGRPGQRCCAGCAAVLARASPRRWQPTPRPDGFPETWSCLPYEGPVRQLVVSWKDGGRRDLSRVLAPVLTTGLAAALTVALAARRSADPAYVVVPAPSSGASVRARGDRPLAELARTAVGGLPHGSGVLAVPALRVGRRVADQAGLDRAARAANLSGAVALVPRWRSLVTGACCLLVDDVVTTGATLAEATRALRAGGAQEVLAVTIAATRRRSGGQGGGGLSQRQAGG